MDPSWLDYLEIIYGTRHYTGLDYLQFDMFYRKAAIEIQLEIPYEFNIADGKLKRPTLFKGSGVNTFVLDENNSKLRHFSGIYFTK